MGWNWDLGILDHDMDFFYFLLFIALPVAGIVYCLYRAGAANRRQQYQAGQTVAIQMAPIPAHTPPIQQQGQQPPQNPYGHIDISNQQAASAQPWANKPQHPQFDQAPNQTYNYAPNAPAPASMNSPPQGNVSTATGHVQQLQQNATYQPSYLGGTSTQYPPGEQPGQAYLQPYNQDNTSTHINQSYNPPAHENYAATQQQFPYPNYQPPS